MKEITANNLIAALKLMHEIPQIRNELSKIDWNSFELIIKQELRLKEYFTITNIVNLTHLEPYLSDRIVTYIAKKELNCLELHCKMTFS